MLYAKMSNSELGIAPRFIFGNLAFGLNDGAVGFGAAGLAGELGLVTDEFPIPPLFPPVLVLPPIPLFPIPVVVLLLVQLNKAINEIASNINFLFFFIIILSFKEYI